MASAMADFRSLCWVTYIAKVVYIAYGSARSQTWNSKHPNATSHREASKVCNKKDTTNVCRNNAK